jgi:two-component system sensor histidine kinase PilS (NtrC family)
MTNLARQLRWYIAVRLVAVVAAVVPYALFQIGPSSEPGDVGPVSWRTVFYLLGLTCGETLAYIALLRILRGRPKLQAYIQFGGDLVLISVIVYFYGGIESPFSLLYLIVIAVASTLLRRRTGITVASAANVLYGGLILLAYTGKIHPPGSAPALVPVGWVVYHLAMHCFGFYAVALLTSYLAREAQRELEEKSEDLADLQVMHSDVIQSINSGLITTDLTGVITLVNQAGLAILDKPESDLVGRTIQDSGLFSARQWGELTAASSQRGRLRSEVELARESGETGYIGFSISQLAEAGGKHRGYIVIFQDLTHWRQLREELRIKDRMAAVGELAAGLAHEIGNPLAAISGSVQMLSSATGSEPAQRRLLDILLKESQRLDRTIKGFLRFAKPRERASTPFDIARVLAENCELLRNSEEVSDRHRVEIDLQPPSVHLIGDADQVSQIFWNLARNALRAMQDGGTLRVVGRVDDAAYRFQVIDTGRGMSEEQRANLFHPFRSFFDSGTGIGMAIVYRIVQDHGGRLHVDSRQGSGTTITVELPRDEPAALTAAEPARLAASELP